MPSAIKSAWSVLDNKGIVALLSKSSLHLASKVSYTDEIIFERSVKELRSQMEAEDDLKDILDTVLDIKPGYYPYTISTLQLREEIAEAARIVGENQPEVGLEIGTAKGGSFYIWSRYVDSLNTLVSLDLPGGQFGGGYNERQSDLFRTFSSSINMGFVRDDSHERSTFEEIESLVGGNVDFLFIDGDHTYEGVKADFEMYGDLVRDDGIIMFHDIVEHPDNQSEVERRRSECTGLDDRHLRWSEANQYCNVDKAWAEIKNEYDTKEIISHPKQTWGGIGVVYM